MLMTPSWLVSLALNSSNAIVRCRMADIKSDNRSVPSLLMYLKTNNIQLVPHQIKNPLKLPTSVSKSTECPCWAGSRRRTARRGTVPPAGCRTFPSCASWTRPTRSSGSPWTCWNRWNLFGRGWFSEAIKKCHCCFLKYEVEAHLRPSGRQPVGTLLDWHSFGCSRWVGTPPAVLAGRSSLMSWNGVRSVV